MRRKSFLTKWMALIFTLSLLASCGGGGGGSPAPSPGTGTATGDTMTLTVVSTSATTTTVYNEKTATTNAYGYDPYLVGAYTPSGTILNVGLYSDFIGPDLSYWTMKLTISISGPVVNQAYTIKLSDISYYKLGDGTFDSDGTGGTITFTQIDGAIGGRIKGNFSGVKMINSLTAATRTISGSFDVTRAN